MVGLLFPLMTPLTSSVTLRRQSAPVKAIPQVLQDFDPKVCVYVASQRHAEDVSVASSKVLCFALIDEPHQAMSADRCTC